MKFLAVFFALVAVASATYPAVASWTQEELVAAVNSPNTDADVLPYLQSALEQSVAVQAPVTVSIPVQATYTMDELSAILHNPATEPALLPYFEQAMSDLMIGYINEQQMSITVDIPAMNINMWTLPELSAALEHPETDPELALYLEHALNQLMSSIVAGDSATSIAVVTPPGVPTTAPITVVVDPVIVIPTPAVPTPEIPSEIPATPIEIVEVPSTPIEAPISVPSTPIEAPASIPSTPIEAPASIPSTPLVPASPLVQLIVNINAQNCK